MNIRNPDRKNRKKLYRCALGATFLKGGLGGRLSRFENALQRQLSAMMLDLRRMQARRKAQGSPQAGVEPAIGEGGGAVPRLAFGSQDAGVGDADHERPCACWTEQKLFGCE